MTYNAPPLCRKRKIHCTNIVQWIFCNGYSPIVRNSLPTAVTAAFSLFWYPLQSEVLKKSKETADQAVNDAIVPGVMNTLFDDVQMHPEGHLLDVKGSNIPLQTYSYLNSSGNICFRYQGHPAELCSITLTDVNDYIDENNDMRQTNEQEIYRGQWMCCELGETFPTGFTFWPRGKLDKIFRTKTIKTGYEAFDKRFNLSCDNEEWVMYFLNQDRIARILELTQTAFGEFAVCLHGDGKLDLAVHSGHHFFEVGRDRNNPEALKQRYTRELKWCRDMLDVFIS